MENNIIDELPESIVMWEEDGMWVIKHSDKDITTQGENRYHALLMLADAMAAVEDADEDLMELSEDVFTMSEEQKEFIEEIKE